MSPSVASVYVLLIYFITCILGFKIHPNFWTSELCETMTKLRIQIGFLFHIVLG